MPEIRYRSGDTIVLKSRALGSIEPKGAGRIISLLPETQGSVRYRVRLQNENFDRSIAQDDIDAKASPARKPNGRNTAFHEAGSSWVDPNAIRTRK